MNKKELIWNKNYRFIKKVEVLPSIVGKSHSLPAFLTVIPRSTRCSNFSYFGGFLRRASLVSLIEGGWFWRRVLLCSCFWLLRLISAMDSCRLTLLFVTYAREALVFHSQLLVAWLKEGELVLRIGHFFHSWRIELVLPPTRVIHKVSIASHFLILLLGKALIHSHNELLFLLLMTLILFRWRRMPLLLWHFLVVHELRWHPFGGTLVLRGQSHG